MVHPSGSNSRWVAFPLRCLYMWEFKRGNCRDSFTVIQSFHEIRIRNCCNSSSLGGRNSLSTVCHNNWHFPANSRNHINSYLIHDWFQQKNMKNLHRYSQLIWKLTCIYFSHQPNKDALYRKTIFYTFKSWGGIYIKFLQILASMSKFMDGWSGPQEMTIFSQAPHEPLNPYNHVNQSKFRQIDAQPFAAGSFALVYRGILTNGEEVAIKILRPSIKKNLHKDLSILRKLCWCFSLNFLSIIIMPIPNANTRFSPKPTTFKKLPTNNTSTNSTPITQTSSYLKFIPIYHPMMPSSKN